MSKSMKHCSILNYVADVNPELHDLIHKLCMGRMFTPKKGQGVTFLCPDKALVKELVKLSHGNNPEEAVKHVQNMLLTSHVPSLADFTPESNIQTRAYNQLPIASNNGKEVVLHGKVKLSDSNFKPRDDRQNIAVYDLSGGFIEASVKASGEPSKFHVKGGAIFSQQRQELFEQVLNVYCSSSRSTRNPAMELLVSLVEFLDSYDKECAKLVRSQLSADALTSLVIVLQPYRSGDYYLSDECLSSFQQKYSNEFDLYCFRNAYDEYAKLMDDSAKENASLIQLINKERESLLNSVTKPTLVGELIRFYSKTVANAVPYPKRSSACSNVKLAFAEAELRVLAALLIDNDDQSNGELLKALYCQNCKLNEPYLCSDREQVVESNIAFYFSTVYLLARSDALLYVPGVASGFAPLSEIADESKNIDLLSGANLDKVLPHSLKESYKNLLSKMSNSAK